MLRALIVDEISMMHPSFFEALDYIGQRVRKRREPFGGIQLVLTGDFFQVTTVLCCECAYSRTAAAGYHPRASG
jgi:ATP-dependent DNA helicase PIF1